MLPLPLAVLLLLLLLELSTSPSARPMPGWRARLVITALNHMLRSDRAAYNFAACVWLYPSAEELQTPSSFSSTVLIAFFRGSRRRLCRLSIHCCLLSLIKSII